MFTDFNTPPTNATGIATSDIAEMGCGRSTERSYGLSGINFCKPREDHVGCDDRAEQHKQAEKANGIESLTGYKRLSGAR